MTEKQIKSLEEIESWLDIINERFNERSGILRFSAELNADFDVDKLLEKTVNVYKKVTTLALTIKSKQNNYTDLDIAKEKDALNTDIDRELYVYLYYPKDETI